mmetsp:Transcript_11253/g.30139  ORF Transcript_11253/g.30139 Transcript_11253/m.30139 type:complete len:83 (-) Transcript_11253:2128-2376(-)
MRGKDKKPRRRRTNAEIERAYRSAAAGSKALTSHFNQQRASAPAAGPSHRATTATVSPPHPEAAAASRDIDSTAPKAVKPQS